MSPGITRLVKDKTLLLLLAALALTIALFLAGSFVYPFGLVVLLILIAARVMHLTGKKP